MTGFEDMGFVISDSSLDSNNPASMLLLWGGGER